MRDRNRLRRGPPTCCPPAIYLEAAATIDPNAKGTVTQIADALAAKPRRGRKPAVAPGTLDAPAIAVEGDDDDELASGAPQDADATSGEVIH